MTIHHTMGVYLNGDRVHNGVAPEHLEHHIEYNQTMRPGRALFVDGVCKNKGYLDQTTVDSITEELRRAPRRMSRVTTPYR